MKFDYAYSIGRRQPDVVVQLWSHVEEAKPFLDEHYDGVLVGGWCVYARRASPNVLWDRLTPQKCEK
jgi:hypothetical protein